MNREEILHFKDVLLTQRTDFFDRVRELESRWQEMAEPSIEREEEAQKATISESYDRLDGNGKQTIEEIDLALQKMLSGDYGVCESCGDDISLKRLQAVPWARLCIDCARELERRGKTLPPPSELIEPGRIPEEYDGLSNSQLLGLIREQIAKDGRLDTEELEITLRGGVIFLEGVIAGEPEHQILMQILTDILGFTAIVDHLSANEVVFEREDRTPGERHPQSPTFQDRLFYDQEELVEDLFSAGDDKPYSPPENPLPYQENQPRVG